MKDDKGKLTWVSLTKDKSAVMMASKAFLEVDLPEVAQHLKGPGASYLYHRYRCCLELVLC